MKMNFRGLTLTAMLLSASNVAFADQGSVSSIGDLPGYGEDAYFADEATYAPPNAYAQPAAYARPTEHVHDQAYAPAPARQAYVSPHYAPVGASDLQPASFSQAGCSAGGCDSICGDTCDGGCDGGCDSACSSSSKSCPLRIGKILDSCDPCTWMQAEFLMWFTPNREMAPLIATSAPGTFPVGPGSNGTIVFGDEIEGEVSGGVRLDYGRYINDNFGIGGRFWILADNNDSYFGGGNGAGQTIGRTLFNTGLNPSQEDAILISANNVLGANAVGNVYADDTLELLGAEAYSRINFGCGRDCKLELIGGYSYFKIDNTLSMSSSSIINGSTQFNFLDRVATENRFNGGQVGFEMSIKRGKWMARSLTKVHLGNMNQEIRTAGLTAIGSAPATNFVNGGAVVAQPNPINAERDVFSFVPEANFKLGYQFRDRVMLSVGYSFLYFDNVALTGDYVNPVYDGSTLGSGGPFGSPAFRFNDSSLWVQGLDLGVIIGF